MASYKEQLDRAEITLAGLGKRAQAAAAEPIVGDRP